MPDLDLIKQAKQAGCRRSEGIPVTVYLTFHDGRDAPPETAQSPLDAGS
jgi:hypothetical protein